MPGPTSRVFFSQRLRLHYVDWGNPEAPPLLLVHGGRDHCRNWDWVAQALRKRLARHRARPARPRRQRVVARRQLHDGGLHLRPRAAHPPAEAGAGHDRRPLARRQHRAALRRHLSRERRASWSPSRGWARRPRCMAERAARRIGRAHARAGSTSSASCRAALPRRYPTIEDAFERMQEENKHLIARAGAPPDRARRQPERGRHLQLEVRQLRARLAALRHDATPTSRRCGRSITCPTLLVYGKESWASNPEEDGRVAAFQERQGRRRSSAPATGCTTTG